MLETTTLDIRAGQPAIDQLIHREEAAANEHDKPHHRVPERAWPPHLEQHEMMHRADALRTVPAEATLPGAGLRPAAARPRAAAVVLEPRVVSDGALPGVMRGDAAARRALEHVGIEFEGPPEFRPAECRDEPETATRRRATRAG